LRLELEIEWTLVSTGEPRVEEVTNKFSMEGHPETKCKKSEVLLNSTLSRDIVFRDKSLIG
jgi:hypothetical protein